MATSESAPRAAVALKEPARKSAASIGTLRIMGLLLSSASTGAPGRLDSEVNEGDPIFERWTSLHIVITSVGTMLVFAAASAAAQTPAPAAPPPPPPYGLPITLEQAKKVMVGAEAEAKKNNWNVVIAVLDSGGNVVMLQRMDGAQFGSIEVA